MNRERWHVVAAIPDAAFDLVPSIVALDDIHHEVADERVLADVLEVLVVAVLLLVRVLLLLLLSLSSSLSFSFSYPYGSLIFVLILGFVRCHGLVPRSQRGDT